MRSFAARPAAGRETQTNRAQTALLVFLSFFLSFFPSTRTSLTALRRESERKNVAVCLTPCQPAGQPAARPPNIPADVTCGSSLRALVYGTGASNVTRLLLSAVTMTSYFVPDRSSTGAVGSGSRSKETCCIFVFTIQKKDKQEKTYSR